MTQVTEAIYANGVLRPEHQLALREDQRVRLIVEPIEDNAGREDRDAAVQRLLAGISGMSFVSGGPLPTRQELHDRV